jgi:hypothetical protein
MAKTKAESETATAPAATSKIKQFKPGSKVQFCRDAWVAGGEPAFLKKATELGLAAGTIKEWTRMFTRMAAGEGMTPKPKPVRAVSGDEAAPARRVISGGGELGQIHRRIKDQEYTRLAPPPAEANEIIYYAGDPKKWGTMVTPGKAKSTVKWANGNVVDVPNNDIHKQTEHYQWLNGTGKFYDPELEQPVKTTAVRQKQAAPAGKQIKRRA